MSSDPSDLAFDISLYTAHDLILAAEESKRVCKEMVRREEVRLNEIANRLFQSDDEQEQDHQQQQVHRPIYKSAATDAADAGYGYGYGMKNTITSTPVSKERDELEQYISSSDTAKQEQQAGGQVALSGSISNSSSSEKPTLFITSKPSFAKYPSKKEAFEKRLDELRQFKEVHGHYIIPYTDKNKSLSRWCSNLRRSYRMAERGLTGHITITKERIEALREIGFDFLGSKTQKKNVKKGIGSAFEKHLDELRQFKEVHGHCIVPFTYDKNQPLSNWCSRLRYSYGMVERGLTAPMKMTKEMIEALREVGFDFSGLVAQESEQYESSDLATQQLQAGGQAGGQAELAISNSDSSKKPTLTSKLSFAKYPKPEKKGESRQGESI